jgi:hypothetical protein
LKILNNHIGYESTGSKHAVVLGSVTDQFSSFRILEDETNHEVYAGIPEKIGPVQRWKDWIFWTIDFDQVKAEGTYRIECATSQGTIQSFPFVIQINLLEQHTVSDILAYFKSQRCSGLLDKSDRHLTFDGGIIDQAVDVHGGWYDASGDYGKHLSHLCFSTYFNPQQIPMVVWSLFKSYEALRSRNKFDFDQYLRRLLDEAMYGADYLVRSKSPTGSFYITVSAHGAGKKPEDRRLGRVMRGFTPESMERAASLKEHIYPETDYQTSYRSGGGIAIAALAIASTYTIFGDFETADYLKTAEAAFSFLEVHNGEMTNDGKENIVDDYCALLAATELYKATSNLHYLSAADKRARSLLDRFCTNDSNSYWCADDGDRPFFHAADGGLPVVSLLNYLDIANSDIKPVVLDTIHRALETELARTTEVNNPFGYSRQFVQNRDGIRSNVFFFPHDTEVSPWWQGENARLGSMAAAARLAAKHFSENDDFQKRLEVFARNQLNWILGLNPFDRCMLDGSGRNNPLYLAYGGSYQFMNAPGGICNGITGGVDDEQDIEFREHFPGLGDNWRWGEQWLPHAAWFILAVTSV